MQLYSLAALAFVACANIKFGQCEAKQQDNCFSLVDSSFSGDNITLCNLPAWIDQTTCKIWIDTVRLCGNLSPCPNGVYCNNPICKNEYEKCCQSIEEPRQFSCDSYCFGYNPYKMKYLKTSRLKCGPKNASLGWIDTLIKNATVHTKTFEWSELCTEWGPRDAPQKGTHSELHCTKRKVREEEEEEVPCLTVTAESENQLLCGPNLNECTAEFASAVGALWQRRTVPKRYAVRTLCSQSAIGLRVGIWVSLPRLWSTCILPLGPGILLRRSASS